MTTYFYGRNSDVEASQKGSSLITQKTRAESYAVLKSLKIDEYFYDRISGTVPIIKREQGLILFNKLKPKDVLITYSDRLSRNLVDMLSFIEKCKKEKISVHLIDVGGEVTGEDLISSMFVKLLGVFNQFYAE